MFAQQVAKKSAAISSIEAKTFQVDNGWGYDIYIDGQKYMHQEHIPAVQGLHPFTTKEDARKAAELVVFKIKNNILPPTLSVHELDSIGVLKNHNPSQK